MSIADDREAAQRIAQLEAALEQQKSESRHYLRNMMAVIRAIARRTGQGHDEHEAVFQQLDGRISAFARVQSGALRDMARGAELGGLIVDELLAHGIRVEHLNISDAATFVDYRAASLLVLVFHELATLTDPAQPVRCEWSETAEGGLAILWRSAPHGGWRDMALDFLNELLDRAIPYELAGSASLRLGMDIECGLTLTSASLVTVDRAA